MKLYLCNCVIKVARYMVDVDEEIKKLHIVRAISPTQAETKVHKYYDAMCVPYCVSYRVYDIDITEEIS